MKESPDNADQDKLNELRETLEQEIRREVSDGKVLAFTAAAVKSAKPNSTVQNKNAEIQHTKEPYKENEDTKVGESTNDSRSILSEEVNLKESRDNANQGRLNELRETLDKEIRKEVSDVKVLENHNYYEQVKVDNTNKTSSDRVPINSQSDKNVRTIYSKCNCFNYILNFKNEILNYVIL